MPSAPNRVWPSTPLSPSGRGTPRPDTPEPEVQQGRRNAPSAGVQLLDAEGGISDKVNLALLLQKLFAERSFCAPVSPMPRAHLREIR
jgi:hypothetical protein